MANDTDHVTPANVGLLDLDEPEPETQSSGWADCPPPEWTGDEQLLIDVKGYIHVRGGRFFDSRVVGRVCGEDGEATIAMLVERFQALEDRFVTLQREVSGNHNMVRHLKSMCSLVHWIEGADAIGDFAALLERAHGEIKNIEERLEKSREIEGRLTARAEELADSNSWRSTGEIMIELMEEWKRAGSGGSKEDEALWQRFRAARSRFFERRSEHTAELKRSRHAGQETKEALIARAREFSGSTDWETTFDAMMDLMDEWKLAESAGRRQDDELFQRFRDAREPFFEARKVHFADQRRRRDGPRRDQRPSNRGRRDPGPAPGRRQPGGSLHASLAELVGPLKDLFPEKKADDRQGKSGAKPKRRLDKATPKNR